MNGYFNKLLTGISLVALSFGFIGNSNPAMLDKSPQKPEVLLGSQESKKDTPFGFLTNVNASIEVAGISGGEYIAKMIRRLQFDVLRIKNWTLHFSIQEQSLFDPSPIQLDHEITYLGIGHQTDDHRITFFWDHTCYNPSRKVPKNRRNDIHWNELGIKYETTSMMPGHKNDGIKSNSGSEWLNSINWRTSLSKIWMKSENDYEYIGKIDLRYDIFRYGRQVIHLQPGFNVIYDNRGFNQDYRLEMGDRIFLNKNIYLTPLLSYECFHDWYDLGEGENFFLAGLRLEMGLDHENTNSFSDIEKTNTHWTPKFHVVGSYTNIFNNDNFGHSSDVAFDLDLFRLDQDKRLRLNTYVGVLTPPDDFNPFRIKYGIGPFLEINSDSFDIKIFHYYSCLYDHEEKGVRKDYNLFGLEIKDNNALHWKWNGGIGVYPTTKNFDYRGDLQGSVGYDFYKRGISPYVNCSGHYLQGDTPLFGDAIEAGVIIPGATGTFSIYLRLQDDFDVFRYGKGKQTLLGIKFKF